MTETTNRDRAIDVARGLAIILVVVGHSGIDDFFWNIVYFFHMPLFFFISGCFFKPLNEFNINSFIRKLKWKELYFPFVKWSVIFLILTPLLCYCGISVTPVLSAQDFVSRLLIILRFRTATVDILGQFWFLPVLFFAHALSLLLSKVVRNRTYVVAIISFFLYFIGRYCFNHNHKEPYDFSRVLYFFGFYLLGFLVYPFMKNYGSKWHLLAASIIGVVCFSFIPDTIFANELLYLMAALSGIYATLYVSYSIKGKYSLALAYVGRNTMDIFVLHTLAMKFTEKLIYIIGLQHFTKGWRGG